MKTIKNLYLPEWLIKRLPQGEELKEVGSFIVFLGFFSILAIIALFTFGSLSYLYSIVVSVIILILIAQSSIWLSYQILLLDILRKRAKNAYKHAKTEDEIMKVKSDFKTLCIPIPFDGWLIT